MRLGPKLSVLFATTLAVGCAVTFGPGDYTGGPSDGGGLEAFAGDGAVADADATLADGAALPVNGHLLVIAGERDGTDPVTGEVWTAPIDAKGDVGVFETLQPSFFRGTQVTWSVVDGQLFIASRASTRSVQYIALDGGPAGIWTGAVIPPPPIPGYGQVFAGTSLVAIGGGFVPTDGGPQVTDDAIRVTPFDGVAFQPMVTSPTVLPIGLRDMTVAPYKDYVYLIGGASTASDQGSKVYVGRRDPTNGVDVFVETTRVVNPQTSLPYAPSSPIACAVEGRLFLLGGVSADLVLSSAINDADGTLGTWRTENRLPGPLRAAGCVVWNKSLHLVGGVTLTTRTDRIIRAPLGVDGLLGDWELSAGEKLPAPRSSIVALTY